MTRRTARAAITAYLAILVPLAAIVSVVIVGNPADTVWVYALMFVPAVSALLAWPISGVRPRFGGFGWRTLVLPIALIAVVSLGYVVGGATGVLASNGAGIDGAVVGAALLPSIGLALGEELGWRGYLLPQLRRVSGFWAANAIVAAVWLLYHLPIILWAAYAPSDRPLGVALVWFTVNLALFSFAVGAIWELTHDVWAAAIAHGSWNVLIADALARSYAGQTPSWLLGEFGFIPVIPLAVALTALLWLSRRHRPPRLDLPR